jgi:hypothetical protein
MKRKAVSASMRWQVFSRDGFRCRYCGVQAGEQGVSLHADHVVSVVDGGTNGMDNLVTACQGCNGGKGARSLASSPGSAEAVSHAEAQAVTLRQQADAIAANIAAREDAREEMASLVCDCYAKPSVNISDIHLDQLLCLTRRHGLDAVTEWLERAARSRVPTWQCVRYLNGTIKAIARERGEEA